MRKNLKTIAIASSAALIAASIVAWAAQTNFLGTVFIADSTTPSQQLKVNADGSINASNTSAAPLYVAGNESGTAPVQTATPANASHTAGQSVGGLFTIPMLRVAGGGGLLEYSRCHVGWRRHTDVASHASGIASRPTPTSPAPTTRPMRTAPVQRAAQSALTSPTCFRLSAERDAGRTGQYYGRRQDLGVPRASPPISVKNQDGTPSVNLYVCLVATTTYTPSGAAYYVNAIGPQD